MKEQSHYCPQLWLTIFLFIVPGAPASAQNRLQTARATNNQNGISDTVYLITVTVNLGHQSGAGDLTREHFVLFDNGIRQDVPFFTRIHPSNDGNDVVYALGYKPPVWLFDGKRRNIRVVVYDANHKKLKTHVSPTRYPGTTEFLDGR